MFQVISQALKWVSQRKAKSNAFVANYERLKESIVNRNEDLEELNKQQLRASKLADGSDINEEYDASYFLYKQANFPESFGDGRVNLFLHGDLQDGIEITATGGKFGLFTPVPYALKLEKKYGNYLGIAPYNFPKAEQITTPLVLLQYLKVWR